ncbi:MAG TPA: hypothetical protein VNF05_04215 [Acidimicrobiales bacterium]|nr:hypothetical protein [Acidimicrobiales bacterium]HVB71042.1 hypothetical protein [Acidimicrobiales bacterium]
MVVYAHASLDEGGAREPLLCLTEVSLGPGVAFADFGAPPGHPIRRRVERGGGVGPSTQ